MDDKKIEFNDPEYEGGRAMRRRSTVDDIKPLKANEDAHPMYWNVWLKWGIVIIYSLLEVFVSITSTSYSGVEDLIEDDFGGTEQTLSLGESMFIVGNAVGPVFLGPLGDLYGRKWLYVIAMLCFALLNIGTALARNLPMLIIMQFLCGTAGSVAISNVAATIADLFGEEASAAQPMSLYAIAGNLGPAIGTPIGTWVAMNKNMGWRWDFWLNVIIGGAFAAGMVFIPETQPRVVIARAAKKEAKRKNSNGDSSDEIGTTTDTVNAGKELVFVFTMAIKILVTEPIVLFLAIYNGYAYGLLFLYLDGILPVFQDNYGLSTIASDLTYLNFAVALLIMFVFFVPLQTWLYVRDGKKHGPRPEARLLISLVLVWGFPISLFWFAWTSDGSVSYWSPIVAGGLLGLVDPLLLLGMLTYLTDSYPHVAGSAIAAFLIPTYGLAAGFVHLGILLFENLSTTWAFACIGFCSLGLVALIYVLFFFGPVVRGWSKQARTDEQRRESRASIDIRRNSLREETL